MSFKIVVGTFPFGEEGKKMLTGRDVVYTPFERNISQEKMQEVLRRENPDAIIAGVEIYDRVALDLCPNLKLIARVGIGVDSVDLDECKQRGISVTNTPDAPSNGVAELAISQMINALRRTQVTDQEMRNGVWDRYIGRDLSECTVGIVGYGRIGKLVDKKIAGFKPRAVYLNDVDSKQLQGIPPERIATLEEMLKICDIVTLHIPLNGHNRGFITKKELDLMKEDAIIMNLSRGGIINEGDLYNWLQKNTNAAAVIDSFDVEPYKGDLTKLSNCYLTPHLGSCTKKSRFEMETGAVKEVLRFAEGKEPYSRVV